MEEEKKQKHTWRFLVSALVVLTAAAAFVVRLANWQLVNGSSWLKTADLSSTETVTLEAARGEILDTNGVGLAVNEAGYAICFNGATMTNSTKNQTILTLMRLLKSRGETWTDELPISVDSDGNYSFIEGKESDITYLESRDFLDVNSYATAAECIQRLVEKYDCTGFSAADTRDILSVRYNMTKTGFTVSNPYTFAESVSRDTVAIISENSALLPGVEAKVTTVRKYPFGSLMPQIIGTMGLISADEYNSLKTSGELEAKGYQLNSRIGKSGIEQYSEDILRGQAGEKTVSFDSEGELLSETVTKNPTSGETVWLTIDSNLQQVLNKSLETNIEATQENGKANGTDDNPLGADCLGGAAVVLRVSDFAILAAASYPSYDMNLYTTDADYYGQLLNDDAHPLVNRAFNGQFVPGSCFKPAVALAALQEGAITSSTTFTCTGLFTLGDLQLHCWTRTYGHGTITLQTALAESCNVFFCNTALATGISAMNLYAKRLGLGVATGVEIGESEGVLAGKEERTASGGTWTDGDTAQAGIGQSDNMLTPLQLATYCATIANNGVRLKTHVIEKVTDYSRENVIYTTPATEVDTAGVSEENLKLVQAGMRSVVTSASGTAHSTFSDYGIAIAGKTGTGQTGTGRSDNVSFIGYAPYDNPQIAIAVVLEHGATSKYSNQVAKDIFDAYFFGKTVDDSGNLVIPSSSVASQVTAAAGA